MEKQLADWSGNLAIWLFTVASVICQNSLAAVSLRRAGSGRQIAATTGPQDPLKAPNPKLQAPRSKSEKPKPCLHGASAREARTAQ